MLTYVLKCARVVSVQVSLKHIQRMEELMMYDKSNEAVVSHVEFALGDCVCLAQFARYGIRIFGTVTKILPKLEGLSATRAPWLGKRNVFEVDWDDVSDDDFQRLIEKLLALPQNDHSRFVREYQAWCSPGGEHGSMYFPDELLSVTEAANVVSKVCGKLTRDIERRSAAHFKIEAPIKKHIISPSTQLS